MPYTIKRVTIKGFQRSRDIDLRLHPDVNFLIGRNGTGKTTFVKLLHYCLSLDMEELRSQSFSSINIWFNDTVTTLSPELSLTRSGSAPHAEVRFRSNGNEQFRAYANDSHTFDRELLSLLGEASSARKRKEQLVSDLRAILRSNARFSWLPLLRYRTAPSKGLWSPTSEATEDPINRKLKELTVSLSSYLSLLDTRVSIVNREFQRDIFLSYLKPEPTQINSLLSLNFDKERTTIFDMANELDYVVDDLPDLILELFDRAKKTSNKINGNKSLELSDLVTIITTTALHKLANLFSEYDNKKTLALFPKEQFIFLINNLLYRKELYFDDSNTLRARAEFSHEQTGPNDPLDIFDLSSGEKQLLVLMLETLLQQRQPYIFLADEPELSLHVEWQSQLVGVLQEINRNSQLIFATHSPDIVSTYQKNVINFELL